MNELFRNKISRRRFAGGMAAILGSAGLFGEDPLLARASDPKSKISTSRLPANDYDALIKLCFNENPYGPPPSVLDAMNGALKYANRYSCPDGGIRDVIAALHGAAPEQVMLGAGSSEILDVVGTTFLTGGKKVVGVEPTYSSVYEHATGLKCNAIRLPLRADFRQDIPAIINAVKNHHAEIGFVYICNPNNPTGLIVTKDEIKQLLDGLPADVPVLIDEAYHHFVENPEYATSVPYALAGRPVIVARTFSKIAGMAGMRLGYAIAPTNLIQRMDPYVNNIYINIMAKWAGAAALRDTAAMERVRSDILATRKKTTGWLESQGYAVISSEANFFMVDLRRDVRPVIQEFRQRGILVGRPFSPMDRHLRVSVGTAVEMERFTTAFDAIMKT